MVSEQQVEGGYVLIATSELCMAWSLYRSKAIRLMDLRVWFGCKEMAARRKCAKTKRVRFDYPELHRLVGGVGGEHLRASLRRLQGVGIFDWSEEGICFAKTPGELTGLHTAVALEMISKISTAKRFVPVPRRHLRLLAGGCKRSVIATLLSHLIRCLFIKRGQINAVGFCKASWIVDVFGIAERNIKEARTHLERIGVLTGIEVPQWRLNRLGKCLRVNLGWARTAGEAKRRIAPPRALSTSGSAPLESNRKLLTDSKNQKPTSGGHSGVLKKQERGVERPTLSNVVARDLQSVPRLLELFRQAVVAKWIPAGENSEIQFLAAAEHARIIGSKNPCGLFAAIVRRKLWQVITQEDERRAVKNLKDFRDRKVDQDQLRNEKAPDQAIPENVRSLLSAFFEKASMPAAPVCFQIESELC